MTDRPMVDAAARARIAGDLGTSLVVEASAGAGKTSALVGRIVAVVRAGVATLPRILALTFTDRAAGEMKLRLRGELEAARAAAAGQPEERARLIEALADLEAARVGTIHSVCADLLRELPVEARVDPGFEIAADEAARLLDEAFDLWFQEQLAAPPEGVRRLLRRRPHGRDKPTPRKLLRDAAGRRAEHRDFDAPWRRDPLDRPAVLAAAVDRLRELAAHARPGLDPLAQNLERVRRFVAHHDPEPDALEAELHELMTDARAWKENGSKGFWGAAREAVVALRDSVREHIRETLEKVDADLAACLWRELGSFVDRYEALKAAAGRLDFLDLLVRCRDLLRDAPSARRSLARRATHVFVDEVQDIDPLQAEVILYLTADDPEERDAARARPRPGSLFVVGDPKQSIYRFRRADLALYHAFVDQLLRGGAELVRLETTFRTTTSLAEAVNAAFTPVMRESPGQAAYAPLSARRDDLEGQPAFVALPIPHPYSTRGWVARERAEPSYADAVGAFVQHLLGSGWRTGGGDPISARHVCILLRRFVAGREDATRVYTRALEARGIAHVLVGGRSFHAREEVLAARNLLAAVEWPDDALAVYAALRGPFFGLSDEELLLYTSGGGSLHPLRGSAPGRAGEALRLLARAHLRRNRRPIADTLAELLEATRAHAGLALWQTGEQALANVLRVLDRARRFEAGGATSFRAFVERLEDEAEAGETGEAPTVEEGTEGVRIMTVHKAKGLEFPVVILGDPLAQRTNLRPTHHVDLERRLWLEPLAGCVPSELRERAAEAHQRDDEEALRLCYVAATRARDLLVVPALGDQPSPMRPDTWLDALAPVIAPRAPRAPMAAPGCPPLGGETVAEQPPGSRQPQVVPGLHEPRAGSHRVVWWGPSALRLGVAPVAGVQKEQLLADGPASAAGREAYAGWRAQRDEVTRAAARPTLAARAATAAHASGDVEGAVELVVARPRGGTRPGGRRFGVLVHAALAAVPAGAGAEARATVIAAQARALGADAAERAAAEAAVTAALAHPLLLRAAAADEARREAPVHLRLPDGTIAEGVVDLAFREGTRWTIVDFKTDQELEERLEHYRAQVALYAAAVRAATGQEADGYLLIV